MTDPITDSQEGEARPAPMREADPRDGMFATSSKDLSKRSAKGGAALLVSQATEFGSSVAAMMYLGRVLDPSDFGLVAMGYSVLLPVLEVREAGLPSALIQRKNLDAAQGDTMFWLNARLQIFLSLMVALSAYPMSLIYDEPRVVLIILIFAAMLLLTGFSIMHRGLLRRQMRFGTMAKIEMTSEVTGVIAACAAAFLGAGWWSLMIQQITAQGLKAIGYWSLTGWLPMRNKLKDCDTVKSMRGYGKDVTFSRIIEQFLGKLDQMLVGAQAGDVTLGLYNRAFKWSVQPTRQLFSPLQQVVVSGASKLQDDPEKFRVFFYRGLNLTHSIFVPVMLWLFIGAGDFIRILLGPKWGDAVPIFRVLVLGGLAGSTVYLTRWIFLVEGTTRRQLKWSMFQAPIMVCGLVVGLLVGLHFDDGALGVAYGFAGVMALLAIPRVWYATADSKLKQSGYWLSAGRPVAASLLAFVPSAWLHWWVMPDIEFYLRAPVVWAVFTLSYCLFYMMLPGGKEQVRVILKGIRSLDK